MVGCIFFHHVSNYSGGFIFLSARNCFNNKIINLIFKHFQSFRKIQKTFYWSFRLFLKKWRHICFYTLV